jgi:uncharacterized protein DUF4440
MRNLRRALASSLLLMIAGLLSNYAHAESRAAEITRLEHEWETSSDVPAYERLLAHDFIGQWADGSVTNKEETIEAIRSGHDTYEESRPGEIKVRMYGTTAVVTGTFYEKSRLGDKDGTGTYRFTDVWVKRGKSWQMVAFQSLRLTPN